MASGAKRPIPTPERERCINGDFGLCICSDPRIDGGKAYSKRQDLLPHEGGCKNYISESPDGFDLMNEFHRTQCYGPPKEKI